jgi:hypothetical protein
MPATKMKWASQGGLAAPGMEQLNLVGDPAKPGPYTLAPKVPKRIQDRAAHPSGFPGGHDPVGHIRNWLWRKI